LAQEHNLAIGSSLGDMVRHPGHYNSCFSWHLSRVVSARPQNSPKFCLGRFRLSLFPFPHFSFPFSPAHPRPHPWPRCNADDGRARPL
jgi:hypothetical protein